MKSSVSVKNIAVIGMFAAMGFVAVLLGKVIPNVAGFLSYDPKDAVVAIAGFLMGPLYTVVISVLVSLVELVTISSTGIIGCLMNIFSTVSFAFPAAILYKKVKSYQGAILGLILGVSFMTASMLLWNYFITPFYMGVPRNVVSEMIVPVFLPFNAIKGGLNAALTLLLYKPLVTTLRRAKLVPESYSVGATVKVRVFLLAIALALLALFTFLFLYLIGVIA
ncbi:MAG: ECF transporter S component [Ruminococcaceae bacterium]|nr:ECF transporter S component [Oscillospiraceae bacterium]